MFRYHTEQSNKEDYNNKKKWELPLRTGNSNNIFTGQSINYVQWADLKKKILQGRKSAEDIKMWMMLFCKNTWPLCKTLWLKHYLTDQVFFVAMVDEWSELISL